MYIYREGYEELVYSVPIHNDLKTRLTLKFICNTVYSIITKKEQKR